MLGLKLIHVSKRGPGDKSLREPQMIQFTDVHINASQQMR